MLLVTSVSLFMVGLDVTIVNVALPSIAHDLHSSLSGLQWTVDVYSVVMASLMMLFGSAGDRFGRRRTFILGLALFSLGSLSSSLAPSVGLLVAFRALQAVGGAILSPVALSIITNTFIHPKQRARAVGVRGSMFGISLALGPIVGGGLVSSVGWRSIFLLNIPIGLAAILITAIHMPESKAPRSRRFDAVGQLLVISLLGTLTYGIIEGPSEGWGSPVILACFAAAATSLIGLLRFETRREEPLVDVRFFRSIPFSSASAIAVFSFGAFGAFLFLSTLYLQDVRGLSAFSAGLAISPLSVMAMIGSIVSGRLVSTRGSRLPLVASGICCVIGCLILVTIAPTTSYLQLLAGYVLFGFGFGLVNAPVSYTAVSSMPRAQAGTASAVTSALRTGGPDPWRRHRGLSRRLWRGALAACEARPRQPPRVVDAHREQRPRPAAWLALHDEAGK